MGAPGLDFQTWDFVDTRLAKELEIEVSHVSESKHLGSTALAMFGTSLSHVNRCKRAGSPAGSERVQKGPDFSFKADLRFLPVGREL
jgi:hypothetical protein